MGFNSGVKGLNLNFLDMFSGSAQISSFMTIRPVGVEFVPCGRTNMTKLTVTSRSFAHAPKNRENIIFFFLAM